MPYLAVIMILININYGEYLILTRFIFLNLLKDWYAITYQSWHLCFKKLILCVNNRLYLFPTHLQRLLSKTLFYWINRSLEIKVFSAFLSRKISIESHALQLLFNSGFMLQCLFFEVITFQTNFPLFSLYFSCRKEAFCLKTKQSFQQNAF